MRGRTRQALMDAAQRRLAEARNMSEYARALRALEIAEASRQDVPRAPLIDAVEYARRFAKGDA